MSQTILNSNSITERQNHLLTVAALFDGDFLISIGGVIFPFPG